MQDMPVNISKLPLCGKRNLSLINHAGNWSILAVGWIGIYHRPPHARHRILTIDQHLCRRQQIVALSLAPLVAVIPNGNTNCHVMTISITWRVAEGVCAIWITLLLICRDNLQ